MRIVARLLTWGGIGITLLPGYLIPNNFDMVYRMGGILVLSIGFVLLLTRKNTTNTFN